MTHGVCLCAAAQLATAHGRWGPPDPQGVHFSLPLHLLDNIELLHALADPSHLPCQVQVSHAAGWAEGLLPLSATLGSPLPPLPPARHTHTPPSPGWTSRQTWLFPQSHQAVSWGLPGGGSPSQAVACPQHSSPTADSEAAGQCPGVNPGAHHQRHL